MEDRMCAAFFTVAFVAVILVSSVNSGKAPGASVPSQNAVETVTTASKSFTVTVTSFPSNLNVSTPNSTSTTPSDSTTINPPTTTLPPSNYSTTIPPDPSNATITSSSTSTTSTTTTTATTKTPPTTISTMKPDPNPTTTSSPTVAPTKDRRFDGPSFVGGIVLCLGILAISFVAFKFYKARTERNYHTL